MAAEQHILTPEERQALAVEAAALLELVERHAYFPEARPSQRIPESDWRVWLILAGRGFGKTRTGAEWAVECALAEDDQRIAVGAPTIGEARDTCIEGESGILSVLDRRKVRYKWNRSMGELELRVGGSRFKTFSGEEPEKFRGPQHHKAWLDELAIWERLEDSWANMRLGLRLTSRAGPQALVTTTPKPLRFLRQLRKAPSTHTTTGPTEENRANLAPGFVEDMYALYGGQKIGEQELQGRLLDSEVGLYFDEAGFGKRWQFAELAEGVVVMVDGRIVRLDECVRFVTIDLAAALRTSRDWTVMIAWAVTDHGELLALELRRAQITERQHYGMFSALHSRWRPQYAILERSMWATELVKSMTRYVPECPIRATTADKDKGTRALTASALFSPVDSRLWLPEGAGWIEEFVGEHVDFDGQPDSGKHDDQVDCSAYAASEVSRVMPSLRRQRDQREADPEVERWKRYNSRLRVRSRRGRQSSKIGW